jgi:MFS family permease
MQSFLQQSRLRRNVLQADLPGQTQSIDDAANDGTKADNFLVQFDGVDDPLNPQNWPTWKKVLTNCMTATVAFTSGFASSIESPVIPQAAKDFHVSEVAESLATVLFLVGFGVGAPLAGPLSETFGRNAVYIAFMALFCCWLLGAALAPNIGAQLVFKFLAGFCGSTAFTTAGGTLGDTFDHQTRGKIFPYFGMIALSGPMIAPVVGAYVGESGMNWRWVEWIALCISGGLLICMLLFLPETYAPTLLTWKAKAVRDATGDPRWQSSQEATMAASLPRRLADALYRPLQILLTEPIIAILTAYLTFVYLVSFSFFTGAPYIFTASYHFNQGSAYLMFVATFVGVWICGLSTPLFGMLIGHEYKKAAALGKDHAEPEAMLWWAMVAAPILPVCLFWLAWSDYPDFSYWSPIIA